jgi:hypothetical protein
MYSSIEAPTASPTIGAAFISAPSQDLRQL